ncbi:MAG: 30S ribosomal protein S10 [Candidatus Diapherotrites archaeon]|nr:30S ribosomal protein S10 [Candidatus Diapherotrites archaeon]
MAGQKARIKLASPDYKVLDDVTAKMLEIADRTGVKHSGRIALPTKKLLIPTRKSPAGGGTETYEKWQMRIHKRIIDVEADERTLRMIMRVEIPENVKIEIEFKEK